MKSIVCILLYITVYIPVWAQDVEVHKIHSLLKQQQESWNHGDLEGYMFAYHKSDSLLFIGKSGVNYGWHKILENYQKGYPDKASMGILSFQIIETRKLSAEYYSMIGKWTLQREKGNLGGHFSLIWKKIDGNWRIVIDHSS